MTEHKEAVAPLWIESKKELRAKCPKKEERYESEKSNSLFCKWCAGCIYAGGSDVCFRSEIRGSAKIQNWFSLGYS